MGRAELQKNLKLTDKRNFINLHLKPALTSKLIEMTIPEKPNSRLQNTALHQKVKTCKIN